MNPDIAEQTTPLVDTPRFLTTVASIAAVIDITTKAISSIDGDGIELIGSKGSTLAEGELHELVSSFTYRAINDKTISHDVVQGSYDYV